MFEQTPIYFIGWDYHSPVSTPLKRLLDHPLSPWRAAAIVHDEVWVPAVDGIPLITTESFLRHCRDNSTGIKAVMKIKDSLHQKLWHRRAKDFGFACLDEGEIFLATERHLRNVGGSIDLGVLQLSDAQDADFIGSIRKSSSAFQDAESNAVLRAYLHFLDTGLLDSLRAVSKSTSENPLCAARPLSIAPWVTKFGEGMAWEIASQRTSFLEQVMLLAGGKARNWTYAFSSERKDAASREGSNINAIMNSLDIRVAASSIDIQNDLKQEVALEGHPVPTLDGRNVVCRIDAVDPLPLIKAIRDNSAAAHLLVRVGKAPMQLANILENFSPSQIQLRCDRPGPLGLQAELTFGST